MCAVSLFHVLSFPPYQWRDRDCPVSPLVEKASLLRPPTVQRSFATGGCGNTDHACLQHAGHAPQLNKGVCILSEENHGSLFPPLVVCSAPEVLVVSLVGYSPSPTDYCTSGTSGGPLQLDIQSWSFLLVHPPPHPFSTSISN